MVEAVAIGVDKLAVAADMRAARQVAADVLAVRPRQQGVEVGLQLDLVRDVPAVGAVEHALAHLARFEPPEQLVGKDDVDVGGDHIGAARPPDADILGDHLEHRQPLGKRELAMQGGRHRDHPRRKPFAALRPGQHLGERRAALRRVPVDQHQFARHLVPPALLGQPPDERLRPAQHIAAVIVIARRRDKGKDGFGHCSPQGLLIVWVTGNPAADNPIRNRDPKPPAIQFFVALRSASHQIADPPDSGQSWRVAQLAAQPTAALAQSRSTGMAPPVSSVANSARTSAFVVRSSQRQTRAVACSRTIMFSIQIPCSVSRVS